MTSKQWSISQWIFNLKTWVRFIESKTLISNRENIEVYVVNLDVFSIGNQCFAFNEPGAAVFWSITFVVIMTVVDTFDEAFWSLLNVRLKLLLRKSRKLSFFESFSFGADDAAVVLSTLVCDETFNGKISGSIWLTIENCDDVKSWNGDTGQIYHQVPSR